MNKAKPYGNPHSADLFIIGHDPRLQISDVEANYVFFMDYLEREVPKTYPERRKYGLAKSVIGYIAYLTAGKYGIDTTEKLYFTNLCNEFLPHPKRSGTVLIPNDKAEYGISEIENILKVDSFKLILPMSLQVFYHLVRRGFVPNESDKMREFLRKARPDDSYAAWGAYSSAEPRAFVEVCGNIYYHRAIPVIPILHVKNWQDRVKNEPYKSRIEAAFNNICEIHTES